MQRKKESAAAYLRAIDNGGMNGAMARMDRGKTACAREGIALDRGS